MPTFHFCIHSLVGSEDGCATMEDRTTIQDPLLENNNNGDDESGFVGGGAREEENLPGQQQQLPPELRAFWSKFQSFCFFGRWLLPLLAFDVVVFFAVRYNQYFYYGLHPLYHADRYETRWRNKSWWNVLAVAVLIANCHFFKVAAAAIDRDVAKVDQEQLEHEQKLGEEDRGNHWNRPSPTAEAEAIAEDWENRQHMYGRVARSVDVWLLSACKTHQGSTIKVPRGTTSFLSHCSWLAFCFLYVSGCSRAMDLIMKKENDNKIKKIYDSGLNPFATDAAYPIKNRGANFENITSFPENVRAWITDVKIDRGRFTPRYDFPTTDQFSQYYPIELNGRIFATVRRGVFVEYIATHNNFVTKRHSSVSRPLLAIPLQDNPTTFDEHDDSEEPNRANRYCFVTDFCDQSRVVHDEFVDDQEDYTKPPVDSSDSGEDCPSARKYIMHCMDERHTQNGKPSIFMNTTLGFELFDNMALTAAYHNGLVFMAQTCAYRACREVAVVDATTMETSIVYRMTFVDKVVKAVSRSFSVDKFARLSRFLQGIAFLLYGSFALIWYHRLVSGVVPFMFAFAFLQDCFLFDVMGFDARYTWLLLTAGTALFHFVIRYSDGSGYGTRFPAWVGKEMYIWALYAWLSCFAMSEYLVMPTWMSEKEFFRPVIDFKLLSWIYLTVTGFVLGHPTLQFVGFSTIVVGVFTLFLRIMERGFESILLAEFLRATLSGFGCIMAGNWISSHKGTSFSRCKYLVAWCIARARARRFRSSYTSTRRS